MQLLQSSSTRLSDFQSIQRCSWVAHRNRATQWTLCAIDQHLSILMQVVQLHRARGVKSLQYDIPINKKSPIRTPNSLRANYCGGEESKKELFVVTNAHKKVLLTKMQCQIKSSSGVLRVLHKSFPPFLNSFLKTLPRTVLGSIAWVHNL